ncbi:MAG: Fic family protein [Myxococcota bacterium]|nr:Fic family protein [Myxococcota bacterium]
MGHKEQLGMVDVDDCTEMLKDLVEKHPDLFGQFLGQLDLSWIYHENALEGVVITHAEMESALKGRPIALDTYYPIRNQKLGLSLIRDIASTDEDFKIDLELMHRINRVLSTDENGTPDEREYRKFIPLHRTYFHEIAQPEHIEQKMEDLVQWANDNMPTDENAIMFAAEFHLRFMKIFPFSKHSGKVGRLLLNLILMRYGYMPVIFHGTERQRYYDTLRHGPRQMEDFLRGMMMNCIDNAEKFIENELKEREKREFRQRFMNAG